MNSNLIDHAHEFIVQETKCTVHILFTLEPTTTLFKKKILEMSLMILFTHLKIGLMILFIHLKIILLHYFMFSVFNFQFSYFSKIRFYLNGPISLKNASATT